MASKVGIINRCFHHLGVERIDNPNQGEPQSIVVDDVYEEDLKSLLSEHPWKFAVKWQVLPRIVTPSDSPLWRYWFEVPVSPFEKIRIIDVRQYGTSRYIDEYDYNGNKIYCNSDNIYIKYLAYVTDPNAMTPKFREAFSMKLAISICIPQTNSLQLKGQLEDKYKEVLADAASIDTADDAMDPIPQTSWVTDFYGHA